MLTPKKYQELALDALSDYFCLVREQGAKLAFTHQTERPYHSVAALPNLPYVCLRIPTGGGKTLLACYSISVTLREFLHQERGLVLWLTPTNAIKEQTLAALRNLQHPYRQALDATLGQITIMDLTEALSVQRAALDGSTVIIVSTLAASRVQDTDVRKVYDENGALMSHFEGLTEAQLAPLEK